MADALKVAVFGAGGVGGYLAARLAEGGCAVSVVARGAHLQAIQEHGLKVTSIAGDCTASVFATDDPSRIGEVDVILVCCKSWQVAEAAPALKSLVGPETIVIPTQNGVDAPGRLAAHLGVERCCGGYIRIQAPGSILHDGLQVAELGAGPLPGAGPFVDGALRRLQRVCVGCVGLDLGLPDIQHKMWRKLAAMGAYSGVCTAARSTIGEVLACAETAALMEAAVGETLRTASAAGVAITLDELPAIMQEYRGLAAHMRPSLMRDVLAGKPSELADQLGAVLWHARRLNPPENRHRLAAGLPAVCS